MKDKFKFKVSRGEEKQNFDFSDPDLNEAAQVFHTMFGDAFPKPPEPVIPEGFAPCRSCEGTGRVIRIKTHLFGMGTSKTVTKDPCPHCGGKGYIPQNTNEEVTP